MNRRRNADMVVETVAPRGKRIIDVGCGDGALVRLLAGRGAHVLGVECAPRQLAKARAQPPIADEEIVEGFAQALPAADCSADVVVFFNSLHHVPAPDMATALAEAARVLKPGGLLYVSEPLAEGPFFAVCRPIDDETAVRAAALAAIRAAGRWGLREGTEIFTVHTIRMESYEAFRERVVSANAEREARFGQIDTAMRRLFSATAERDADGAFLFDQPMRVNLLRMPSAPSFD